MPIFQRAIKTIQHADDGPGVLGAGEDAEALTWDNGTGKFVTSAVVGGGGVSLDAANVWTRQQTFHASVADVSVGSEILTDSTFPDLANWNDDSSGWTALNPGLTHNTGSTGSLSQAVTIDTDNVYLLEISVSGMSAGWVDVYDDNSMDCYAEANGVVRSMKFTASGSDTIHINVSSDFDGQIDYVSLKASVDGSYPIGFPADLVLTDADGYPVSYIRSTAAGGFIAGYAAGRFATSTIVAIGDNALDAITTEDGNVGIGPGAGQGAKCYNSLFLGPGTGNGETRDAYAHIGIGGDWISGQTASGDPASQSLKFHAAVINMADLPTSSDGLSSGDLWNNSGVINVA